MQRAQQATTAHMHQCNTAFMANLLDQGRRLCRLPPMSGSHFGGSKQPCMDLSSHARATHMSECMRSAPKGCARICAAELAQESDGGHAPSAPKPHPHCKGPHPHCKGRGLGMGADSTGACQGRQAEGNNADLIPIPTARSGASTRSTFPKHRSRQSLPMQGTAHAGAMRMQRRPTSFMSFM